MLGIQSWVAQRWGQLKSVLGAHGVCQSGRRYLDPVVFDPQSHTLSPEHIDRRARQVVDALWEGGHEAYLVGGCVRDLLLSQKPKDFDVVTDATPEQIHALFKNSRLIGRRFRLVHVYFGRHIVEVATYRRVTRQAMIKTKLRGSHFIPRDNAFGTRAQDAMRRDFNVNALYYDVRHNSIIDYASSMSDLTARRFSMIGDPERRYREDPVRLLRAIRLMAKSNLKPCEATEKPIKPLVALLASVAPSRLFDEINKAFMHGYAAANFACMARYGMFGYLFPQLPDALQDAGVSALVDRALQNTDERFHAGKSLNPAFLLSVFLWPAFDAKVSNLTQSGIKPYQARQLAVGEVFAAQLKVLTIPKRLTRMIKEIWFFQSMLEQRRPRQVRFVMAQKRFRAAYDFLCLRAEVEPILQMQATWWTDYQAANGETRDAMLRAVSKAQQGQGKAR